MADSRAGGSVISSKNPVPDLADESRPYPPEMGGSQVGERINESGCRDPLPQINQFPVSLKYCCYLYNLFLMRLFILYSPLNHVLSVISGHPTLRCLCGHIEPEKVALHV